jgi:hypothetical protein
MAIAYTVWVFDQAARISFRLAALRMPSNKTVEATLDLAQEMLVGYCIPAEQVTLNQMTDVFCSYLKDTPQKRDGTGNVPVSGSHEKGMALSQSALRS